MFQFIRAEVYARRASTNEKSKSIYNISDILGEALRDENHIPHVDNPKEPRYIIGSEVDIKRYQLSWPKMQNASKTL